MSGAEAADAYVQYDYRVTVSLFVFVLTYVFVSVRVYQCVTRHAKLKLPQVRLHVQILNMSLQRWVPDLKRKRLSTK